MHQYAFFGVTVLHWQALLLQVDECATEDVQVHSMQWMVQEVHEACATVSLLSEDDAWFQAQSSDPGNDATDLGYWGKEDGEESEDPQKLPPSVPVHEQVFAALGNSLRGIKALQARPSFSFTLSIAVH